ncbi:MAG: GNAT family N-acetyltransferase [Clostridia bacterium]|nr:GNAT family N-acetyltransferase [Clostridia bacterium]
MIDGRIVGMVTLMKTDYYPLPDTFPWVSTLFVTEEFRGHRISKKLIDAANSYARELGFDKTYIPTEHVGLYEKYGYRYVKDIVNYANGIDRLYAKQLQ